MNSFILALSTLVGAIVGAGIFGIPYAIAKSGVVPGIFYLGVLAGAVLILHLLFGEVCLRTKEKYRLIGYARRYLGKWGEAAMIFATFVGTVGTLLAYIIIGGDFLKIVLSPLLSLSPIAATFLFWLVLSLFVFQGIRFIAKTEFLMNIALFIVIALVFLFAIPHIRIENFSLVHGDSLFLPYGIILFALIGWSAIPEIAELFKKDDEKKKLRNVLRFASLITFALYALFVFFVIGVSGANTSPDALGGLVPFLGENIVIIGAIIGLFIIADSYIIFGDYLKNSLYYDYKIPLFFSAAITISLPLALFMLGLRQFSEVVAVVGSFIGAVEGVTILLLFQKARHHGDREPEYIVSIPRIFLIFLGLILISGALLGFVFP
ncbi:MAG: hypothetical protein HYW95_02705 [Candidatus Wildermuthbacteria bacterium]|nr:hypothetical protein [Candidatus Wildermuthbacteria bacterium]